MSDARTFHEIVTEHPEVSTIGRVALMITDDGAEEGFCGQRYYHLVLLPALRAALGEDDSALQIVGAYVASLLLDCRHAGTCEERI